MTEAAQPSETTYTLHQAGRLVDVLGRCMAERLRPHRSGWSAAVHLASDLERHFGVRAPMPAIQRALTVLIKKRRIRMKMDDDGVLWYRLWEDESE